MTVNRVVSIFKSKRGRWFFLAGLAVFAGLISGAGFGQGKTVVSSPEARTAKALDRISGNPLELHAFLVNMPKGADLHVHLSGAIYAETFIKDAVEDNLCVDVAALEFAKPIGLTKSIPPKPVCGEGRVPAATTETNQKLYDDLVDTFSMRSFVPHAGVSGHDQFFATFDHFRGLGEAHFADWIDEVASRAASQNEQYLELMHTPDFSKAAAMAAEAGWDSDLERYRDTLLAKGLRDSIPEIRKSLDDAGRERKGIEHCGQPDASEACQVEVRFLFQVLRGLPQTSVFAQTLLGFELAAADARVVGLNFVMPEDGFVSMRDYSLQMRMLDVLHRHYPGVKISLHAGEVAPGLVPPDGLRFHIRAAVEQGHALRIGHGVDVMYEDRPYELLHEMATKHVMVEINLTSNDVILGISGKEHPFPIYRKYGVPVALSTDDEGVSRIDLTHEYARAVVEYGLKYQELKHLVRTGVEHSFISGTSLWVQQEGAKREEFSKMTAQCGKDAAGSAKPSATCSAYLASSEKAQQEWELERRFREFEKKF